MWDDPDVRLKKLPIPFLNPMSGMSHTQRHRDTETEIDAISKRFNDPVHRDGPVIETEVTPKNKGPHSLYFFRV